MHARPSRHSHDPWSTLAHAQHHTLASKHGPNKTHAQGVVHAVLDKAVVKLEALISRKTFNQLGGLQLDRDVRTLVSACHDWLVEPTHEHTLRLLGPCATLSLYGG